MPVSVRAAVSRSPGEALSVETVSLADPGPDEVGLEITACAVCHSDLSFIDGDWAAARPAVWGHEATGIVIDLGGDHTDLAVGETVVVSLIRSCGACRACRAGNEVACCGDFALDHRSPLTDVDGRPVAQGLGTAAFAEAVVVHRSQVVKVPDDLPPASAALLGCGVLTGSGAVRRSAGVQPGQSVVVVGAGGVGLSAIQTARLIDAGAVVAVDPAQERRAAAVELGASHVVDSSDHSPADLVDAVRAALGGLADHVLVTTGSPQALDGALDLVAPGGALTLVGMAADGTRMVIDPVDLAATGRRVIGSKMGAARPAEDIPWLVERTILGDLDLEALVGQTFTLADVNDALDALRQAEGVRPIIVPDRSAP